MPDPGKPYAPFASSRRRRLLSRKLIAGALLCVAGLALAYVNPEPLRRLDLQAQDALSARIRPAPSQPGSPRTVLALLGEKSLREVHQWPWPRRLYAEALGRLGAAALVVFDITMPERSTPEDDALLCEAVREHGKVIMALYVTRGDASRGKPEGVPASEPRRPDGDAPALWPVYPFQELFDAAAGFGVVNVLPDSDGIVRRSPLLWRLDGLTLPSLSLSVPLALGWEPVMTPAPSGLVLNWRSSGNGGAGDNNPDAASGVYPSIGRPATLALDDGGAARFLPAAPGSLTVVEFSDLLDGLVAPETLRDSVVVIGVSAPGASDLHRAPGGAFLPGSVLVAQGISALWQGVVLRDVSASGSAPAFAAVVLLLAGAATAALRPRIRRGAGIFVLLCLAWGGLWIALMHAHWLLPLATPLAAALLIFSGGACYSFFVLEKDWAVRSLPLEAVLLAPERRSRLDATDAGGQSPDFPAELRRMWPKIHAMCGCVLLEARAPSSHASVAALLAESEASDTPENTPGNTSGNMPANMPGNEPGAALVIIPEASGTPPENRMLIPLASADKERQYAVIGWSGAMRAETLKSVAALVVSLASQHAFIESQARNQAMLFSTIRAIAGAIDAKDPITAGHSERVAALAKNLALWLGYSEEQADEIFFAGILHDVGKIGVPDAVLGKEGKLTDEEFSTMRGHPAAGDRIMRPINLAPEVASGILQHHERPDGKGYPDGLRGDAISDTARILKIADVYDALVSERQYKKAWPVKKALTLLHEQKGVEFDPHMVDVFLERMSPAGWVPETRD